MFKSILLKIQKAWALPNETKIELFRGFYYYIKYILWGQFQSFKPLESGNHINRDIEVIANILAAYELLCANISKFKDCKCRTYVLYNLCRNRMHIRLLFGATKDCSNNILAHCWIESKNNENISDLYNEHQQFNIPLSKINDER